MGHIGVYRSISDIYIYIYIYRGIYGVYRGI